MRACVAHGERTGMPVERPPEMGDGGSGSQKVEDLIGGAEMHASCFDAKDQIDVARNSFETVLGNENRHSKVVYQALQSRKNVFRSWGIEL